MKRIWIIIPALILAVTMLTGCAMDNTNTVTYEKFAADNAVMPVFDELGDYLDVKTLYHHEYVLFLDWTAYSLVARYEPTAYPWVKDDVLDRYHYRQDDLTDKTGKAIEPTFSLDGFDFRVLDQEYLTGGRVFPEQIYMVGFDDVGCRIAYLYFLDNDLDTIESFPKLLQQDCAWDRIMKESK